MSSPIEDPRTPELAALYRIASVGTRAPSLAGAVKEVLRAIGDVVPSERTLLFLHDPEKDDLRTFGGAGEEEERVSLTEPGIVRRVFHSGRAELINDVVNDPDSSVIQQDRYRTRQIALAPLVLGDRRLGVIAAVDSRGGAFTDGDLHLLSVLADHAAIVVNTALLTATVQRQARELEGLHRLSRLLLSQESLDYVIGESIRTLSDHVPCEKMMVLLYDDKKDALCLQPPTLGIDEARLGNLEIPLWEPSLASTVFRTSTALMSNDAAEDAWVGPRLRALLGIKNVLAAPLITDREPIGVLEAINSVNDRFDDEDLRFTTLLSGRISGVIELSRARVRERALVQRLREADRTKSDFVSVLAHELKGPMTTIMGFGQTLEEHWGTIEDGKRTQFLGIVRRETERLAHMVSDLLDMSRMESGTLRYDIAPMSLGELIDNIIAVHTSLSSTHGIKVDLSADLPFVLGDRDRIRQVIINLLTNATRYSPEGTTITITGNVVDEDGEGCVRIGVIDEGIGIAPEDAERVFSKFAMLPKPAWTKKGTGLGLFITKGIVEGHGGRLWIESQLGEGSTFYFTLPAADRATAE